MKWLITGGCGFIGRALISDLLGENEHAVCVLDNLSTGTRAGLARIGEFAELNIDDQHRWSSGLSLLEGDVAHNFSDTSKARKLLGWSPTMLLEDGLRRTVRYFLDTQAS